MAEFSQDLPNFSISLNLFSNSNVNKRFPMLPEEDLANLRSKKQNKNTSRSTKTWLMFFNEWKVQHNVARKLEHILCRFFPEIRKQGGDVYEPESPAVMQCSLDRHLKNFGRNYSILSDSEFANSRQQLEAKARELRVKGYGKRKNASHPLSEADVKIPQEVRSAW